MNSIVVLCIVICERAEFDVMLLKDKRQANILPLLNNTS